MSVEYANVFESRQVFNPAKRKAGYGSNIPTDWEVRLSENGKWIKVFAVCYSNRASFYINHDSKQLYIRESDFNRR